MSNEQFRPSTIRRDSRSISTSWFTRSKNFARSTSAPQRRPDWM